MFFGGIFKGRSSAGPETRGEESRQRRGELIDQRGPYYLLPDSAEPPPPDMWAELDIEAVEADIARVNERIEAGLPPATPSPELVKRLESGGPSAQSLLRSIASDQEFYSHPEIKPEATTKPK